MFGGIRLAFLALALGVPVVLSFVITGPIENSYPAGSAVTISWIRESGDPSQFSVDLINSDSSAILVAKNVDAVHSSFSFTMPSDINPGDYTMALVDTSDTTRIFTSRDVQITAAGESAGVVPVTSSDQSSAAATLEAPTTPLTQPPSTATSFSSSAATSQTSLLFVVSPAGSSTETSTTASSQSSSSRTPLPTGADNNTVASRNPITTAAIIGIALGALLALISGIGICLCVHRYRRRRRRRVSALSATEAGTLASSASLDTETRWISEPSTGDSVAVGVEGREKISADRERLEGHLSDVQRQLEDLQGVVGHSASQNEILRARIRMLEDELQGQPPAYM
ncbi:hypothetical protein FB45DRAFT_936778 [Roridomyces roridus]|uniref:Yeast cell wall synthesis Kre9/Knh1-like N-terminal domain-containing protein n=1 Tax=Roridomyces roridus TaxID=1738132 RepID=A0AAD7FBN8_9AGAR|nr:hypothetical protein FB45DRAFT_936778 [Roridomyces roridus]